MLNKHQFLSISLTSKKMIKGTFKMLNKKCKIIITISDLNKNESEVLYECLKKISNIKKVDFKILEDIPLKQLLEGNPNKMLLSKEEVLKMLDNLE